MLELKHLSGIFISMVLTGPESTDWQLGQARSSSRLWNWAEDANCNLSWSLRCWRRRQEGFATWMSNQWKLVCKEERTHSQKGEMKLEEQLPKDGRGFLLPASWLWRAAAPWFPLRLTINVVCKSAWDRMHWLQLASMVKKSANIFGENKGVI